MNRLSKFYALSAIYFGLASAVSAQSAPVAPASSSQELDESRKDHFEHPILEERGSHDLRPAEEDAQRIQRRGMQDTRRDGEMRRNIVPDARDTVRDPVQRREGGDPRRPPVRAGQPD